MSLSLKGILWKNEFWAFLFALGWVLFSWPMLTMAQGSTIFGAPAILAYVAAIWLLIILILYFFDRRRST
jgi:NADH:ubiquinone oxidoreductase subunit 6 (subunit J)